LEIKGLQLFDLDTVIEKCSKIIIDWNVNREYSQSKSNCQQFIDELCKELGFFYFNLGFDLDILNGPFGDFLNNIREKGSCDISFPLNSDFKQKLKINEDSIKFKTHEELDIFVSNLEEVYAEFKDDYRPHYLLLKSFDRAFWLRHMKFVDDENYQPCSKGCPFGDPNQTASIKNEWF
jgi:hypothetical protein